MINPEKPSGTKTHRNKNLEKPKPPLPTVHQNPTGTKTHIKKKKKKLSVTIEGKKKKKKPIGNPEEPANHAVTHHQPIPAQRSKPNSPIHTDPTSNLKNPKPNTGAMRDEREAVR